MLAEFEGLVIFAGAAGVILVLAGVGYLAERYWRSRIRRNSDETQLPILGDPIFV